MAAGEICDLISRQPTARHKVRGPGYLVDCLRHGASDARSYFGILLLTSAGRVGYARQKGNSSSASHNAAAIINLLRPIEAHRHQRAPLRPKPIIYRMNMN